MERNSEIDGIRGWAALLVVFFHFFQETFGRPFPQLHSSLFGFILNGHLMVLIFFILSGDALSVSYFKNGNINTTCRLAIARYFRLTFPVLASCAVVYLLMISGLTFNLKAATIVGRQDWMGVFINFQPDFINLLSYAFDDVYFAHSTATSYNPFLWTMSIELLGSLIVFINIFILGAVAKPLPFLITQAVFFIFVSPYYSLFIFGMLLGYARKFDFFVNARAWSGSYVFTIGLAVVIILISMLKNCSITIFGQPLQRLVQIERLLIIWAMIIVSLIYASPIALRFFKSRVSVILGEMSFPIYITQFIVLVSFLSYGIVFLSETNRLSQFNCYILAAVSLLFTFALAVIFRAQEKIFLSYVNAFIVKKIQLQNGEI